MRRLTLLQYFACGVIGTLATVFAAHADQSLQSPFKIQSDAVILRSENAFKVELGYAQATDKWATDAEKLAYGDDGSTSTFQTRLEYSRKVVDDMDISAFVRIDSISLVDADVLNRQAGDNETQVSRYGLTADYLLADQKLDRSTRYRMVPHAGVSFPGGGSEYDILSVHDGAEHLAVGLLNQFSWNQVSANVDINYTLRTGVPKDVWNLGVSLPVSISQKWTVTPMASLQDTMGGIDLNTPDFENRSAEVGGPAIAELNEDYVAVGVGSSWVIQENINLNGNVLAKLDGKNTDKAARMTLGLDYFF